MRREWAERGKAEMPDVAVEAACFIASRACEPITLADVADHVGYSPFHLARAFERAHGQPPGRFLAAHRFQRAKRLLLETDERVSDICCEVGFSSVGTFTRRFTTDIGLSPVSFRRLPDLLSDAPPRPVLVAGTAATGGAVTGSVRLSPAARIALGGAPAIYVGLFPRRAPRGVPVVGALLDERDRFELTGVPPGTYWLLATAFAARAELDQQLVPGWNVVGGSPTPVRISPARPPEDREITLQIVPPWSAPVLVALPPLASPIAQDRRRQPVAAGLR
ncbi:helix-turn-helix transcriptional regulator [Saccharopolyspora mangrovi]|uniref:Helix-turn-helix transcriptional regulator n=1 Tax=Saccharopolyspora mangrovi TaxID=3082379 RepID=A0ABU6A774_9PSEU|nr:helix-turn-helix transcriptional regulator [Saccharopolyspora sp. S2-29]MEB3367308.1 helix-turn-helix transcriptional regulator [Saccharopolyspora sp. S2-29]